MKKHEYADLVFSPDDEADSGKGWYVQGDTSSSPLLAERADAEAWARDRNMTIVSVFDGAEA